MSTLCLLTAVWGLGSPASAQAQDPPGQAEDVVRVNTKLVQTDLMVFDKQGNFIEGLKRNQFVLKVDGKPREVSFFEQVHAGSRNEEAQLAAARGTVSTGAVSSKNSPLPLDRGRTVFFFLDDLHLSPTSMHQARQVLLKYINGDMGQNDQTAIASTTGQIGFLQQLTDNKTVLRAAIERLKPRQNRSRDFERPPMTEYQALLIDGSDRNVLGFFVDEVLRQNPGISRTAAEEMVKGRATQMLQYAASLNTNTLSTLESLVHNSAQFPGRKVLFFISDGFFLDPRNSDTFERLRKVSTMAAASGVVIYSIDARGLIASTTDASSDVPVDPTGRLRSASSSGEIFASQDGLNGLARDTGGRPFFNTNNLSATVGKALKESSVYYLIAWRPETDEQRSSKFRRINVEIAQRPELIVRFRSGFGGTESSETEARSKTAAAAATPKTSADELRAALRAVYPKSALPVSLTLNFLNLAERGSLASISIKVATESVVFALSETTPTANLNLVGVIFDDQGKVINSLEQRLTITAKSPGVKVAPQTSVYYHYYSPLKPGLYQVRIAARDPKGGTTGSAIEWIEIPNLTAKALTLSSLIVGEKKADSEEQQSVPAQSQKNDVNNPFEGVGLNVDRHFARSSRLRFLVFVYNALQTDAGAPATGPSSAQAPATSPARPATVQSASGPDLAVQVQIFRDNEPVITSPLRKIPVDGAADLTRVPYAAELALEALGPGLYVLQVTVIDRLAKTSAGQRFHFQVD